MSHEGNGRGPRAHEVRILAKAELKDLFARLRQMGASEEDCAVLEAMGETLAWVVHELEQKCLTLARLRSLFGIKSEKTGDVLGDKEDPDAPSPDRTDPSRGQAPGAGDEPEHKPKPKGHGRNGAEDYVGAERVHVPHESLRPGDRCPCCEKNQPGKLYLIEPSEVVRVVGQAPLVARVYVGQQLRCGRCRKVYSARMPEEVGPDKYDASAKAMIALLRYGTGVPHNRLARLEDRLGFPLPAATQWELVAGAADQIEPALEELIRQAAQGQVIGNDDTSMQVLDLRREIDRAEAAGTNDSERTGIFTTGIVSELASGQRAATFHTGRLHAGENLEAMLRRRATELGQPIQVCDALDRNLPKEIETLVANCLVHARRHFVEVAESFPSEVRFVLEILGDVYRNEAVTRQDAMDHAQRLLYHQTHSAPRMAELKAWLDDQIDGKRVEPNSTLGDAIGYMRKRWDRLTLFLRVPGAPLDTNIVERALKKAIIHRNNSLFYKTARGAHVGDLYMSLIHTAELNQVNPFNYLVALIEHADQVRRAPSEWMPWNYQAALDLYADSS